MGRKREGEEGRSQYPTTISCSTNIHYFKVFLCTYKYMLLRQHTLSTVQPQGPEIIRSGSKPSPKTIMCAPKCMYVTNKLAPSAHSYIDKFVSSEKLLVGVTMALCDPYVPSVKAWWMLSVEASCSPWKSANFVQLSIRT